MKAYLSNIQPTNWDAASPQGMVLTRTKKCLQFIRSYAWNHHRANLANHFCYCLARHFIVVWIILVLHGNLVCFCFQSECKYFAWLVLCSFCDNTFSTYWPVPSYCSTEVLQNQKCLVGDEVWASLRFYSAIRELKSES